jgi:hypothetical protein
MSVRCCDVDHGLAGLLQATGNLPRTGDLTTINTNLAHPRHGLAQLLAAIQNLPDSTAAIDAVHGILIHQRHDPPQLLADISGLGILLASPQNGLEAISTTTDTI